jgi:hypothetical protein
VVEAFSAAADLLATNLFLQALEVDAAAAGCGAKELELQQVIARNLVVLSLLSAACAAHGTAGTVAAAVLVKVPPACLRDVAELQVTVVLCLWSTVLHPMCKESLCILPLQTSRFAAAAAAAAAEVGHNMGLLHDSTTLNVTRCGGHGDWAPVRHLRFHAAVR